MEGLRDAITGAWTAVTTKVTEIIEGLHTWITDAWNTIKTKVTEIVQGLRDSISNAFQAVKDWFLEHWPLILGILTGPFGLAIVLIIQHRDKINAAFQAVKDWFTSNWPIILSFITKPFIDGLAKIGEVKDSILSIINTMLSKIRGFFATLKEIPGKIKEALKDVPLVGGILQAGGNIRALLGKAQGGPVTAGVPYRVGERGPETFIPTGSGRIMPNGAGMGGGLTVNVYQTINGNVLAARQMEDAVVESVIEARRRGRI